MRVLHYCLLLLLPACAAEPTAPKAPAADSSASGSVRGRRAPADSCASAKPDPNAALAEGMVAPGYSGELTNYFGEDKTRIDFIHYFQKGRLVKSRFFYASGKTQEEYYFLCGALHGEQRFYYENGKLAKTVPYRWGRMQGTGRRYDEQGRLREEAVLASDSIRQVTRFDKRGRPLKTWTQAGAKAVP